MKTLLFIARATVVVLLLVYVNRLAAKQHAVGDFFALVQASRQIQVAVLSAQMTADGRLAANEAKPGTYEIQTMMTTWHDNARDRDVPVKIYWPVAMAQNADNVSTSAVAALKKPLPLLLFSHGLGGSREMYVYLGQYWSSHGFIVVHLQHLGSDDALWRDNKRPGRALTAAVKNPEVARNRPLDVTFAIDQMLLLNQKNDSPFFGRVDKERIGVAGHSYGAYTVLALAGQGKHKQSALAQKIMGDLTDPRIKAMIPMSAPVDARAVKRGGHYDAINVPMFHMTGTRDDSMITGAKAKGRRVPFDGIHKNDGYLMILNEGDHMVFSGRRRSTRQTPDQDPEAIVPGDPNSERTIRERDAVWHDLIERSSLAFWRAYLLDDADAKAWLQGEGFKKALGNEGTLEMKLNN